MPDGCVYAMLAAWALEACVFLCGGLLFAIASGARDAPGSRMSVAIVLLAVGGAQLIAITAILMRRLRLRPSAIEESIVALARDTGGHVKVADVAAFVGCPPDQARAALDKLVAKRLCERTDVDEYQVSGIEGRKIERKCPYCGASLPVREQVLVCPQCGGSIELKQT